MTPQGKVLKIRQHMEQEPNANNPDISFKKKHQEIHCNGIIGM